MPYITKAARTRVALDGPQNSGQLNYAITKLLIDYVGDNPNYELIAMAISACECAKLEFYRRVAAPYEDVKREQNGDVYNEDQ